MTPLNLKKWTTALTLCAVTMTCTVAPAFAADTDTAIVGEQTTPNLAAAAQAMAAATQQLNGGSTQTPSAPVTDNNASQQPSGDTTESYGIDYVSLANPAQNIGGQTYLPLRATLEAMKDQALGVDWKAEGQEKLKLYNDTTAYEVYLVNGATGLQVQQGGATYSIQNVNGVLYVPQDFFQAIIPNNNISLSGSNILVLASQTGSDVWANLWGNMNAYQAPVVEPPVTDTPVVDTPDVETPDVTYPDVDDSTNDTTTTPSTPSVDQGTVDEIVGGISDATARNIIATAMQYIGVPYVWGGTTPAGFDCSGLVQYVFAQNGISLPRTTYDQIAVVQQVSLVALQPGDLVFWGGASPYHVGIYIGDGQYIHAPAPGQSVCIQSYDAYPFDTAGRVLA